MTIARKLTLAQSGDSFELSDNERAWIEFIRLCAPMLDPAPTLRRVQELRLILAPAVGPLLSKGPSQSLV